MDQPRFRTASELLILCNSGSRHMAKVETGNGSDDGRSGGGGSRGRIVIAEPETKTRRGIRDALRDEAGFVVVASAGDGTEALELITFYRPDIALIELELPGLGGLELTERIATEMPEVGILIFSSRDDDETQLQAFRAGASGFVSKRVDTSGVASAVRGVLRGEAAVSRTLAMSLVERLRALPDSGTGMRPVRSKLTPREWEVADLMSEGLGTGQIANKMVLSEGTIYTYIKHILRKLDVHSREEAIRETNRMREPGADPEG